MSTAAMMLASHAENVELFHQKERLFAEMVRALVGAIEAKDHYTRGHSERVALFARRLAERRGLDEEACKRIYLSGLLHDVGKIGVESAILARPANLKKEEFEQIKHHPESGWNVLHELQQLRLSQCVPQARLSRQDNLQNQVFF